MFLLELEISVVAVQRIHQNNKNIVKNCQVKMTFCCLSTFCCYDYGTNASEAVQMIATDQKDYHKGSSRIIVC